MSRALLPASASALQRVLADRWPALRLIPTSVIETIWDAWRCPAPLLPWLAEALSVDLWDDGWSEIDKRRAIADSPAYHRRKGTRLAVEQALDLVGRPYTLTEWWQRVPGGRRGTATVFIAVPQMADVYGVAPRARRLVDAAKPKSRAVAIAVGIEVPGDLYVGGVVVALRTLSIEPWTLALNDIDSPIIVATALLAIRTTTVVSDPIWLIDGDSTVTTDETDITADEGWTI